MKNPCKEIILSNSHCPEGVITGTRTIQVHIPPASVPSSILYPPYGHQATIQSINKKGDSQAQIIHELDMLVKAKGIIKEKTIFLRYDDLIFPFLEEIYFSKLHHIIMANHNSIIHHNQFLDITKQETFDLLTINPVALSQVTVEEAIDKLKKQQEATNTLDKLLILIACLRRVQQHPIKVKNIFSHFMFHPQVQALTFHTLATQRVAYLGHLKDKEKLLEKEVQLL